MQEIQLQLGNILENKTSRIIVFDIETQKGFDEIRNIPEMKVAVAVSCDCSTGKYKYYTEDNVSELIEELFSADTVIGYNVISFDYCVLKGYTSRDFNTIKTIDMMRIAQVALGFRPKLDNLVTATLEVSKTADGLQSLRWFKEDKIDLIKEYCHADVRLTKELYEFGRDNGFIYANNRGSKVKVPIVW
ncbi:MAG: hypothetical protein A2287_10465 [Candidatus Melainabacteria bacterium RIFOXYA12_FULL_32_12]|nr:MAG: hypothetical protein A2255_09440 [Candidatus Melainabacteria bacterium RIFOXYA2_FULL_32_9]OGI28323.1 MAG: hypothetical protein A2287_10465 [Candidatus Melainabacteria bacterium RIFOXYA12_FULL_32_12]